MTDEQLKEKILTTEEVYNGQVISLERWQVELPDGKTALREIVKHGGAVGIVPVDAQGNVTLVRQDRVAVGRLTWEIPAGKLDSPEEDPFSAAHRELEEETGLHAENWHLLTCINTTPGFCTERIWLYVATGLSQHEMHLDEDEFLNTAKLPLEEATALCMKGELRDSKTVVALLMAQRYLTEAACLPVGVHPSMQRGMGAVLSPKEK